MAARLNNRHAQQSLEAIKVTQLLKRLMKQALGEIKMDANQIRATEILLRKKIPDLKATEYTDKTPQNITFQFFGQQPQQAEAIEAEVIQPIEDKSKVD